MGAGGIQENSTQMKDESRQQQTIVKWHIQFITYQELK